MEEVSTQTRAGPEWRAESSHLQEERSGLSSSFVRAWGEAAVRAQGSGRSAGHDFQSSPAHALAELLLQGLFCSTVSGTEWGSSGTRGR